MRLAWCVAALLMSSHGVAGQVPSVQATAPAFSVSRADGGPTRTELGYGVVLNKNSSMRRQALTVHDSRLPVQITGDAIVQTVYGDREYNYKTSFVVTASEPLTAIEVRFILFDVFGARMKVLSSTDVVDIAAAVPVTLTATWRAWENEASEYMASLAFVARARTQSGQVINADLIPILAEANKFAKKLTVADLEPKTDTKP